MSKRNARSGKIKSEMIDLQKKPNLSTGQNHCLMNEQNGVKEEQNNVEENLRLNETINQQEESFRGFL